MLEAWQGKFRAAAGWLLWTLLAGYLVFNKPFAQLGAHPVYIGEIVLGLAVLACALNFASDFLQPLRDSWAMRAVAAFWLYTVLRALIDARAHGLMALRDGVVGGYAILAFVAPALWLGLAKSDGPDETRPCLTDSERLARHVHTLLIPLSLCAMVFAAAVAWNWIGPGELKVDFLTLAAAVCAWICLSESICLSRPSSGEDAHFRYKGQRKALFLQYCFLAASVTVLKLPTRAVWLSFLPLCATVALAFAFTPRRRLIFAIAAAVLFGGAAIGLAGRMRSFAALQDEYALNRNLDFSLAEIDGRQLKPEEQLVPAPAPLTHSPEEGAPRPRQPGSATAEKLWALVTPDDAAFQTPEGQLAAHSVRWRAAWWLRCWHYTLHRAPIFGAGFGHNLTNVMRTTTAWPMYVESMRMTPPNRSPHSAHVTIFTRLGLLGLVLWLALLALVFAGALRACWSLRAQMAGGAADVWQLQKRFWRILAVLGVWVLFLWTMSFGVIVEGPFGGMWFWALTGVLARIGSNSRAVSQSCLRVAFPD